MSDELHAGPGETREGWVSVGHGVVGHVTLGPGGASASFQGGPTTTTTFDMNAPVAERDRELRDRFAQMAMVASEPFQRFIRECGPGAWERFQEATRDERCMPIGLDLSRLLGAQEFPIDDKPQAVRIPQDAIVHDEDVEHSRRLGNVMRAIEPLLKECEG
jgi:hypothetical protein